jgi:diguanylate cyclase (GGDEF)-like protein
LTRKAEVAPVDARALTSPTPAISVRAARLPRTTLVRARRHSHPLESRLPDVALSDVGKLDGRADHASQMQHPQNDTEAWQLIHDDPFDQATSDERINRAVTVIAARSVAPYMEVLRRLVGVDDMDEAEAHAFFRRVVEHRRTLSATLGRPIHIRVAALDLLTTRPSKSGRRRDSHPIIVTPSLLEKAFEVATADGVTGLPQRAHFMNLLRHELRQRKRRSVCVAFVDLDGFKRVNDDHGHARGDEVLCTLGEAARGTLREGDVLARIGGDEFAILLVDASPEEADAALRRLRDRFEQLTVPLGTSFSAGIAVAGAGEAAESVVMRADEAMYRQKRVRAGVLSG